MTVNNMVRNEMSQSMARIASGNRINSAKDDAAGLAIVEQMTSQIRGTDQGTRNTQDMQALIKTAEGGLDNVSDSLNRIRELSIQALNDTNTPANREMIQQEISQLADGIQASVGNTQFNGMNLLYGTVTNANTASSANGTGAQVTINNMSGVARAMTEYNVTGAFDLNRVDSALNEVNSNRANLGAMSNRMDSTVSANNVMSLNMSDARSRIQDADIAKEMMSLQQSRILEEAQVQMQRQQQQRDEEQNTRILAPGGANM